MTDRRFRVLVTDEIDPEGVALLRAHPDIEVVEKPTRPAAEVLAEIGEYDAFVGRSATRVTRELLQAGDRLRVIGRAGVGVDNVDLRTATEGLGAPMDLLVTDVAAMARNRSVPGTVEFEAASGVVVHERA